MIVVSDTGPLNYLVLLGCVDVLPRLYGDVVVPASVLAELWDLRAPLEVRDWASSPPSWVKPMRAAQPASADAIVLGPGETEAILLAEELGADLLLMDDLAGRMVAKARGLKVGGTLSVLAAASRSGLIDLNEAIVGLRKLGFRASEKLLQDLLAEYGKPRPS